MANRFFILAYATLFIGFSATPAAERDFQPDPASVQRYGKGYRYPQAGWVVLHIEGEPYERGVQHGRLLAPEIAGHVRCFAAMQGAKAPAEAWKLTRTLCNALFQRRYHREYLEEMKGIADGASAAGAKFDGRPIDLLDIVALNSWAEIDTLDSALDATPIGLEGIRFPKPRPQAMPRPKGEHCSAFAATGPATRDGKIVFGHITMFALYPSNFYNVWLDVKPAKGHRVFMQSYPGGMQSGMDYYFNDAGLLVCETTIQQTRFDATGLTVASRIREALQYADGIDQAVEILKDGNNGLYTNEWLLADTKTNEIAMFELGTAQSRLFRSSKKDWFAGTEGFYWGCNNTKDMQVRFETIASPLGRPASTVFRPSDRDKTWLRLYEAHKGKIDVDFGKLAFTTPPLAAFHSLDAKFTTSDLAKEGKSWALFGPPLGRTWHPSHDERQKYPDVLPLVGNGWTVLHAGAPKDIEPPANIVDLHNPETPRPEKTAREDDPTTVPAWHGTIRPKTDADAWLAAAFARFERIVALENTLREKNKGELTADDREHLGLALFEYRAKYTLGARAAEEVPLAKTRMDPRDDAWHHVAEGKGVLLLNALRNRLGAAKFEAMMDDFGRAHGGKEVSVEEFRTAAAAVGGTQCKGFFDAWLNNTGLPTYKLENSQVTAKKKDESWTVKGTIQGPNGSSGPVEVTVETADGEKIAWSKADGQFTIELDETPRKLIVDKFGICSHGNGGPFSILTFLEELEKSLIVVGTGAESNVNREAAEALQQAIRERHANYTVPMKLDSEATTEDLKNHHVILIGRPDSNAVLARWHGTFPVTFGSRSFAVRGETLAHAESAILVVAENPTNKRFSTVAISGLSGRATLRAAPLLVARSRKHAEVVLLPHDQPVKSLVLPAKDLTTSLGK